MASQRVIVFGGSGFLGSHVADTLTEQGYSVRLFDHIESPFKNEKQEMILGSILDSSAVNKAVEGCDIVYNFAAISDIDYATHRALETIQVNILGNAQILEACRQQHIKRYIYASTVYVFSRVGGFYRCSKQAAEQYIEEYQRTYGLNYTILRYGSLYGPRSDHRNGLWRIIENTLKTGKISYKGSPDAMREYIHVEDAARASVLALGNEFENQHVVLTGQEPIMVIDLLKMLAEILKIPAQSIIFMHSDHPGHYIRTPYAYEPKLGRKYIPPLHVDLGQGLLQLIGYIRNEKFDHLSYVANLPSQTEILV